MNIFEILSSIDNAIDGAIPDSLRGIHNLLLDRISDPETIIAFPAHLQECSRTKFLQTTWQGTGIAHPSGPTFTRFTSKSITCSECHGSIVTKFD